MKIRNLFDQEGVEQTIQRINQLTEETQAQWGKMHVSQMLAHLNVSYDMDHTNKYEKPKGFRKFMIKLFAKKVVVGNAPYPKNGRTAPQFIIEGNRNFTLEKERLIENLRKTMAIGADAYNGRDSHSFGPLNTTEWNNLYSKHIDHHLGQFGV